MAQTMMGDEARLELATALHQLGLLPPPSMLLTFAIERHGADQLLVRSSTSVSVRATSELYQQVLDAQVRAVPPKPSAVWPAAAQCPKSKDGRGHCQHWWDEEPCCWCGSDSPCVISERDR